MDVKRTRSPRAPPGGGDDDKTKRGAGWRGASGVRPEMVLVGFLLTLPLLFLVFGGRWGSGGSSSFPSSSSSSSSTPPVVSRHVAAGERGATPQSQSKLPSPLLRTVLRFGL
jgi:xyloglucan fucosyltransferase